MLKATLIIAIIQQITRYTVVVRGNGSADNRVVHSSNSCMGTLHTGFLFPKNVSVGACTIADSELDFTILIKCLLFAKCVCNLVRMIHAPCGTVCTQQIEFGFCSIDI